MSPQEKQMIEQEINALREATIANLSIKVGSDEWVEISTRLDKMRKSMKNKKVKFKAYTTWHKNMKNQEVMTDGKN